MDCSILGTLYLDDLVQSPHQILRSPTYLPVARPKERHFPRRPGQPGRPHLGPLDQKRMCVGLSDAFLRPIMTTVLILNRLEILEVDILASAASWRKDLSLWDRPPRLRLPPSIPAS